MITGVAIRYGRVMMDLPKPARHGDILNLVHREFNHTGKGECGFVDHLGNFLTRDEAWYEAERCGQPISGLGGIPGKLFSEDLW